MNILNCNPCCNCSLFCPQIMPIYPMQYPSAQPISKSNDSECEKKVDQLEKKIEKFLKIEEDREINELKNQILSDAKKKATQIYNVAEACF